MAGWTMADAFVHAMFWKYLGRPPEPEAVARYCKMYKQRGPGRVEGHIAGSDEARNVAAARQAAAAQQHAEAERLAAQRGRETSSCGTRGRECKNASSRS